MKQFIRKTIVVLTIAFTAEGIFGGCSGSYSGNEKAVSEKPKATDEHDKAGKNSKSVNKQGEKETPKPDTEDSGEGK